MKNNKRIVIALGGNALGDTPKKQEEIVKITSKSIVDIIEEGNDVVVVHGNGPQVGMISLAFDEAQKVNSKIPTMPLSLAVAMSQGYIGLHLKQAIDNELLHRKINNKQTIALVSQIIVDENDISFKIPTKPIGPFYNESEAKQISKDTGWTIKEDAGRGWRRMVPSPKPVDVVEKELIKEILNSGHIIIAGGGGGVPTLSGKDGNKDIDAVIDKDFTAEKIAELIDADILLIVTEVDGIYINWATSQQEQLVDPTISELEKLIESKTFPSGSMGPKVEAAVKFAKSSPSRKSCITSLESAREAIDGKAGTWIKQ